MAFKKFIWHFYVAVAFQRLPGSGRALRELHCSNSLRAPSPLPREGPAQGSRERGRAWGGPALPSARGGGGGCGGAGGGEAPGPPPPPPRGSPARRRETCERFSRPLAAPAGPRRPAVALRGLRALSHLPRGNLRPLASSVSPRRPLGTGCWVPGAVFAPRPGIVRRRPGGPACWQGAAGLRWGRGRRRPPSLLHGDPPSSPGSDGDPGEEPSSESWKDEAAERTRQDQVVSLVPGVRTASRAGVGAGCARCWPLTSGAALAGVDREGI